MKLMNVQRRALMGAAVIMASAFKAKAQPAVHTISLWPASPPGHSRSPEMEKISSKGAITNVTAPRLRAFRPDRPNGMAAIVMAGGGYAQIDVGNESTPMCRWLQLRGITAFELIYRLPERGGAKTAPFQDAQRAVRIVRAYAHMYGIDPERIGVIGFAAGGHLAGMTAVSSAMKLYPPVDPADSLSARPDFAALIYPVLSMMPLFDRMQIRREVLGPRASEAENRVYSVERNVDHESPPTFLAQASDDLISPIDNSLMMFSALRAVQVPAEMHIFQSGGHGWGIGNTDSEVHIWPELFAHWIKRNDFFSPQPKTQFGMSSFEHVRHE